MKILGFINKGNNVECTVCGSRYKKFLPYGRLVSRENALCPNCLSLERHRLMYLYLKEKTNFFTAPLRVLHIAPEHCFIKKFMAMQNLTYITADLESPLAMVKMDIHDILFEENYFDVVFCNHVMEHVQNDIKAMKEIYRVLKPGGWAIIQSPLLSAGNTFEDSSITDPKEREKIYGQDDHVRSYGKDYGQRLASAGFEVVEDDFVLTLPKDIITRYALPAEEIIYFCKKV